MRYWTSDWHLNSEIVRQTSHRPWKTAEEMNKALLTAVSKKVTPYDQVIHVGDLLQSGKDRGTIMDGYAQDWKSVLDYIDCQLICVEGNHDSSNDVPFICRSMKTRVGNWNVTVGHYPTWYDEAAGTYVSGHLKTGGYYPTVHVCGHVHNSWQVSYDATHCVLNINVGIDANKYKIVSESELVELIDRAYRWFRAIDTSVKSFKTYSFRQWENEVAKQKATEAASKQAKMMEWLKANKPEIYAAKMSKKVNK